MAVSLQAIDATIKSILSVTGAPGVSLGVLQSGKIVHTLHHGCRDVERKLKADSDTIYGVASLTKSMTAGAIAMLVGDGKLSWTTPVKDIIPELNSRSLLVNELATVTDLLIHDTGLSYSTNWWYGTDGDLLLEKEQTISAFNALPQRLPFRTMYSYSNWPYCVAGEVIERVSGLSFGEFLATRMFKPLGMNRTSASHDNSDTNLARPYAVLRDSSPFPLPFPRVQSGTIMAPAQAVRSTLNDMILYASALLGTYSAEKRGEKGTTLKDVSKQWTAHIFKPSFHNGKSSPTSSESSYGLGMSRVQLPGWMAGIGCNEQFVQKMPTLVPGPKGGLVLVHTGTVAGYTSFLTILPEYDTAFFVAVNSIGLGDPAGWITQLLIETITESPAPNDFVSLAEEAAKNHANQMIKTQQALDDARKPGTHPQPLTAYTGDYVGFAGQFKIQIRMKSPEALQVIFQGLESQTWDLKHYQDNTFTWLEDFDTQAKRVRFTFSGPDMFKLVFKSNKQGDIESVLWKQEAGLPDEENTLIKSQDSFHVQK